MSLLNQTKQLLTEIDEQWPKGNYPNIAKTLYQQAIELYWELIDKSFPVVVSTILYRTLFEQLISLLFILHNQKEMANRSILFEHSARLRLELRLKKVYETRGITSESKAIHDFFEDYSKNGVVQNLEYAIRRHKEKFDAVAIHYMTEASMVRDDRRRRWYRMQKTVYPKVKNNIENLADVSRYLLGDIGVQMYYTFYSFASLINHGKWLEEEKQLNQLAEKVHYQRAINFLLRVILRALKEEPLIQGETVQHLSLEELDFILMDNQTILQESMRPGQQQDVCRRLQKQITLMLESADYFRQHKHVRLATLLLRPALDMMKAWFNDSLMSPALFQQAYLTNQQGLLRLLENLTASEAIHKQSTAFNDLILKRKEQMQATRPPHKNIMHRLPYHSIFLHEVTNGLFSVYVHGIDLNSSIRYDGSVLPGSASNLAPLVDESMEALRKNADIIEENNISE